MKTWEECLTSGESAENAVARYLEGLGFIVKPNGYRKAEGATYESADLFVERHISGQPSALAGKTLEVKCEYPAHRTGNAAIEVFSNMATGRLGWVHTSTADYLGHLSAGDGLFLIVPFSYLREKLKDIWHRAPLRPAQNLNYTGVVLLVPREQLQEAAIHVGRIKVQNSEEPVED